MGMMGPQCPACGSKVKMPKSGPLPPPRAKVKCPSCGTVGELEAFLRAGQTGAVDTLGGATLPAAEEIPSKPGERTPAAASSRTRISGTGSALNLPAGIRCTLTVISGPDRGKKLELDRPRVVVGRRGGDFVLTDEEVSTQHCAFEINGVSCTVKDLGSSNGTWVDGQKVERAMLGAVQEVVIGASTLLFTMTLDEAMPAEEEAVGRTAR